MDLNTPRKNKPTVNSFPTTRNGVKAWLKSIDDDGIGGKVRSLYKGLKHSNRLENRPSVRIELMELFRSDVWDAINNLERRYLTLSLPLPSKSHQVFDLVIAFLQEMSFGYKIAIEDSVNSKTPLPKKLCALASQRAITYLSEIMSRCAQLYYSPPNNLWRDIHQLYAYAENTEQHLRTVKDNQLKNISEISVSDTYKRVLLFNLSRPESLQRGEANRVFNFLETILSSVTLGDSDAFIQDDNLFAVNLASDSPPSSQRFLNPSSSPQIRVLDSNLLLQEIEKELAERPLVDPPLLDDDKLTHATLERLALNLGMSFERKGSRGVRNSPLFVELGIKDIHAYINHTSDKSSVSNESKSPEEENLKLELEDKKSTGENNEGFITHPIFSQKNTAAKLWQLVEGGHSFTQSSLKNLSDEQDIPKDEPRAESKQNWVLSNRSDNGFGLTWTGESSSHAHVGEVIALTVKHKKPLRWSIGVIRWMHFSNKNKFSAGVELLSSVILPTFVQQTSEKGESLEKMTHEALLLPKLQSHNDQSAIMVPSHMYSQGDEININLNGRHQQCSLNSLVEQTGDFALFVIELKDMFTDSSSQKVESDIDKMDVWDIIS